jgi:hypothetical protein
MADPISAGVVGSVLAPSAGVALAAPTLTTALGTGLAAGGGMGGGTLFGFNPTIGGFGQGIMEGITGANKFMNQNPITSQLGMQLAGSAFAPDQQMQMAPSGQINRSQIQPMDYMSLLNPQNQSVIRPPQISLLG